MPAKPHFAASVQSKKGRLYAVMQVKKDGTTKPVWRALGLSEGANKTKVNKAFREVVAQYTAAVVKHFHRCFGHADIHALANQVVGNRILVPAIRNKIVVGDLGNRPDGRFKRTDRQRQHIGLLFFQIGTAAAASHLLELAAVQLIQLFSNCLIQFPQRKEFAVA